MPEHQRNRRRAQDRMPPAAFLRALRHLLRDTVRRTCPIWLEGHITVMAAVGLLDNWFSAKMKIRAPRVATWPAAGVGGERADLFRGGQARIDEGGCLGACQDRLFRCRITEKGGERLKSGATVHPARNRDSSLLDLGDRNRPSGQETKHNSDSTGDGTIAVSPAPDASWLHAKELSDTLLLKAERAKRRTEFDRSRAACFHLKLHRHNLPTSHTGSEQTADGVWMRRFPTYQRPKAMLGRPQSQSAVPDQSNRQRALYGLPSPPGWPCASALGPAVCYEMARP